ncbi:MAG: lysine biosynthesis protein LysW [Thaumarchaeota archaeon]|nr:lysine biosynthesis protein LysW [Nitrososphaerota archaeon]
MPVKCQCPKCDAEIKVPEDTSIGEIVSCPDCGEDFEIASKNGGICKLKNAEKVGEDWGE